MNNATPVAIPHVNNVTLVAIQIINNATPVAVPVVVNNAAQSFRNILTTKTIIQNVIPNNVTNTMITSNEFISVSRNSDVVQLIPLNSIAIWAILIVLSDW